jgi:hypothetical protein
VLAFHGQHAFALGTVIALAESRPDLCWRWPSRLVATASSVNPHEPGVIANGLVIAATRFSAALQPQSAHPAPRSERRGRAGKRISLRAPPYFGRFTGSSLAAISRSYSAIRPMRRGHVQAFCHNRVAFCRASRGERSPQTPTVRHFSHRPCQAGAKLSFHFTAAKHTKSSGLV